MSEMNQPNKEVKVECPSLLDGLAFFVAVGPAFLFREGVVYGSDARFLSVVHKRAWSAKEAEIYPSA
jgi:hypothetical protein